MFETLIVLAIVIAIIGWAYRSGKCIGSRKGYGVGREHGRRRRW